MKALAFAVAVSLTVSLSVFAQDSRPLVKPNGASKQPAEAAANIDVAAIQKKIDDYTAAIRTDPNNDKFYGARGQNYQRLGKLDLAAEDLNHAVSLNPSRQAYFIVRGDVFEKQERYREALNDYSKALACGPPTFDLLLRKGKVAGLLQDYKTTIVAVKGALAIKQDDVGALVMLGGAEQQVGMLNDSVQHLSRAIELNPSNRDALRFRAASYLKLGKKELAEQDANRVRQLGRGS